MAGVREGGTKGLGTGFGCAGALKGARALVVKVAGPPFPFPFAASAALVGGGGGAAAEAADAGVPALAGVLEASLAALMRSRSSCCLLDRFRSCSIRLFKESSVLVAGVFAVVDVVVG